MLTCHLVGLCLHPAARPQSPTAKCLDPVSIPSRGRTLSASVFRNCTTYLQKSTLQAHCTIQGTFGFKQVFQNN